MQEDPQRSHIDANAVTMIVIIIVAIALSRLLPAQPLAQPYTPPPITIETRDDHRICVIVANCN